MCFILKIEQRFELKMRCYTTFYRWQQQRFQKNPLVVRRNFKHVKVSGILLAVYILGFCYTVIAEPISTIDASSSIPGKIYCIFVYNIYSYLLIRFIFVIGVLYIICYKDVEDVWILQHDISSKIFIAKESFEVLNIAI